MGFIAYFYEHVWYFLIGIYALLIFGFMFAMFRLSQIIMYRLWVRLWITPDKYLLRKTDIRKKEYILKGNDAGGKDNERYIIDENAIVDEMKRFRRRKVIEFVKGYEFPLKRNWRFDRSQTSENIIFLGAKTFDALMEKKHIVEIASIGQKKGVDIGTILLVVLGVVVIVGGIYYFTHGGNVEQVKTAFVG